MMEKLRPGRVAFLFNANAKSVTKKMRERLREKIYNEDLYFSESLEEAKENVETIINKNYRYLFCGGGDGTVVNTINMVRQCSQGLPDSMVPRIGVLRLGTGNALARTLESQAPFEDIESLLAGHRINPVALSMVETKCGMLTPFAGIGYDGEIMNDFDALKDVFFNSPFRKFFSSFFGFTVAGVFRTIPRQFLRKKNHVVIKSSAPAYRIMENNGQDEEILIDQGETLYEGVAPMICVGTITSVGYGFKLFPFAERRPGFMHLRIVAVPLKIALSNFYPSVWYGHFRHEKLFDYLVKDVTIDSDEGLAYQFAGDAMGEKKQLFFQCSQKPVEMCSLSHPPKRIKVPNNTPLLTPFI